MLIFGAWYSKRWFVDVGFINDTLYQGEIDFQNIPGGRGTYWVLPLTGMRFVSLFYTFD